jgi:protein gp37
MTTTKIEWTDRTWNPVTGCTKVSRGCDHCYAEGIARRFAGSKAFPNGFDVTLHPERITAPLRWRKPARVFVNSMSDLFHADIPDDFIARVFAVMAATPFNTYQVLTKRHGRMRSLLSDSNFADLVIEDLHTSLDLNADYVDSCLETWLWPLRNVWLGVSVEDQQRADLRIPALLDTPAAVRFLSCEPLLGPIVLCTGCAIDTPCALDRVGGVDWVIVGGESGPGARPMEPAWARDLRDQSTTNGVPFFFKQWGGRNAKAAGRDLDGRTWDEYPAETR